MRTLHMLAALVSASCLMLSVPALAAKSAKSKQPATHQHPPSPLCGQMGGRPLSISEQYPLAGIIFDQAAHVPGSSCQSQILLAGVYLDINGQPASNLSEQEGGPIMLLTVASREHRALLSAKPSIHDDIQARSIAASEGSPAKASLSRSNRLRYDRFFQHDYYLHTDVDGYRVPFKECMKIREGEDDAVCEFIYENHHLGLSYRVSFDPSEKLDYEVIRLAVAPVLEALRNN